MMTLGELYEEIRAAQVDGIRSVLVSEDEKFGYEIEKVQIIHHKETSSLVIFFNKNMYVPLAKQNAAEALLKWQQHCRENNVTFTDEEINELLNQRGK